MLNLHSHVEGRVRASTAAELAPLAGIPVPALTLDEPSDLTAFLAVVSSTFPFLARPDWVERIVHEAVVDAAADGVRHLELRFSAAAHGDSPSDMIAAACSGLAAGRASTGISAGLVVSALRKHPPSVNADLARLAVAADGVTGFDLSGNETKYPDLRPHAEAFAIARAGGLGVTAHAAEGAPGSAAVEAVSLLGVRRIGHGTHVADDPSVLAHLGAEGVVLEVCPTSNVFTGAVPSVRDHPAPRFRAAGIRLVLGDDNPVQTGSPFSTERKVLQDIDISLADVDRTSLEVAFLTASERAALTP